MSVPIEQYQMENTYVMLPISLAFLGLMHTSYRLINENAWFDRQKPFLQGALIFGVANIALLPTIALLLPPYVKAFRKLYPALLHNEFKSNFYTDFKKAFKSNLLPTLELGILAQAGVYFFKTWMMAPLEKQGLNLAARTTVIFLTLAPTYLALRTLTCTAIEAYRAKTQEQEPLMVRQPQQRSVKEIFKERAGIDLSLLAQTLALIGCNYVAMEFMPTDKKDENLDLLYKLLVGLIVFVTTLRSPLQTYMDEKNQAWGLCAPSR